MNFITGLGMLLRVLATYRRRAGIAMLLLGIPAAAQAQLPDAPSFVKTRQGSEMSRTDARPNARPDATFSRTQNRTGFWKNINFDFASSAPRTMTWNIAWNAEPPESPQETLYKTPKENLPSGFSSSIAEEHPVPGDAPALYNSCPGNTCLRTPPMMCCGGLPSPFTRYLKGPNAVLWTARDNLKLAVRHLIDPFNLGTIVVDAAIGISLDSHSAYGPGIEGVAKYSGVSLTEDMTGEFFGTFLIPSLVHQDPRYHRVPYLSIKRRLLHAVTGIVWTQSYTGKPMPNYGNVVGSIATAIISNTFVPGPNRQGFSSTAQRLALAFAISPTGNLIAEFFPDVANRINLRVVIFQRILNTVSIEESGVP